MRHIRAIACVIGAGWGKFSDSRACAG